MGSKERRARERDKLRGSILDAALAIAREKGWDAVTVRAIAAKIEFSPALLYLHFENKKAILSTLALDGMEALGAALRTKHAHETPDKELARMVQSAWTWGFANPMLFQLMQSGEVFEFGTAKTPQAARSVFLQVRTVIEKLKTRGGRDADDLTDLLWAGIAGLIQLTMAGRIAGGKKRAQALLTQLVSDFMRSWSAAREGGRR